MQKPRIMGDTVPKRKEASPGTKPEEGPENCRKIKCSDQTVPEVVLPLTSTNLFPSE